ncbi:hypothetical protein BC832DRAFT_537731 [Gaertneriomyces semiglobifer]|nr:hypothetical protein BC832DRAFT_537731 [Gaertneriomyces semiglobifer]
MNISVERPNAPGEASTSDPPGTARSPFSVRNVRYIRIGPKTVLQMILYIRQKDLNWFNEAKYMEILRALQPLIPRKLDAELLKKDMGLADVCRMPTARLQIAYCFKDVEAKYGILQTDPSSTTYSSYFLHNRCLTVVVEPYDPADRNAPPPDFLGFNYRSTMRIDDFFVSDLL